MQLSSKARKVVASGLAASTLLWGSAIALAPKVASAAHSNGCLVLSGGTVWLITNGTRRGFTSAEVFMSHGYNFLQVVSADSDDTALPVGPIMTYADGTLVKGPNDPLIYLVVNGQKRGFVSGSVFTNLGYMFANVQVAPANTFADLPTGANIDANTNGNDLPKSGPAAKTVACSTTGGNNGGGSLTGEGSVDDFAVGTPEDSEISEGQDEVELVSFDVELSEDGSLRLNRFDLYMAQATGGGNSTKPWDYFTEAILMVNGDEVGSMDVDSSSDWTEYDGDTLAAANEYRLRFTNVNAILPSGETSTVSVAFSAHSTMDSADEDAVWQFGTTADSFRFEDGTGFIFTDGEDLASTFSWDTAEMAALSLTLSEDSPEASVIEIDESSDTNDVHIATYTIEETEGVDLNISEIKVDIEIADPAGNVDPAGAGTVVRRAMLVVDGDVIGTETVASNADNVVVTFDNIDLDIDADEEVDVEIHVDIEDTNSAARYDEGTTVWADDFDVTEFEDEFGNDDGDIAVTEAGVSEAHELRTAGIMVEFVSASETRTSIADATDESDTAEFKIAFDVTAFGDDMRVDKSCEVAGGDLAGQGTEFSLAISAADTTGWGIVCTQSAASTDTEDTANVFEIDKDTTRRITLTVNVTPDEDSFVEAAIASINWGTATNDTNANYYTFNLDDFKTDSIFLNDM